MAAPVVVQTSSEVSVSSGTSGAVTITGVAAGNLLVLVLSQTPGQLARTFSESDDNGNTWALAVQNTGGRPQRIAYAKNTAAGNTLVTVTATGGSATFAFRVVELSGADTTTPLDATSTFTDASTATSHPCAAVGAIDTVADVIVFAGGHLTNNTGVTAVAANASYTDLAFSQNTRLLWQRRTSATALTDERAEWTHTGTARAADSAIASFKGAAAGATYNESVALDADAALAPARTLTLGASLSLQADSAVSPGRQSAMVSSLALTGASALTPAGALEAASALALEAATSVEAVAQAIMSGSVGLGVSAGLPLSAPLTLQAALGLIADAALASSYDYIQPGGTTYTESVSLVAGASLTPTALADFLASVALTGAVALTPGGQLAMLVSAAFAADATFATSGGQAVAASVALTAAAGLDPSAQRALAALVAFEAQATALAAAQAHLSATLGLPASATQVQSAAAAMSAGVVLSLATQMTLLSQIEGAVNPLFLRLVAVALLGPHLADGAIVGPTLADGAIVGPTLLSAQVEPM